MSKESYLKKMENYTNETNDRKFIKKNLIWMIQILLHNYRSLRTNIIILNN